MLIYGKYKANPALPYSDATNGYDLLTDVAQCILDEPRRFYMPDWVVERHDIQHLPDSNLPACGTAACIGGWTALLKRGMDVFLFAESVSHLALNLTLGKVVTGEQYNA